VRRLSRALLPPLAAFLLSRALLVAAAAGTERPPWSAGSWSGPDSAHYLSIAREGYRLFPCSPDDPPPGVCGNAGWMPLYPWLMRPLLAGRVVSPRWVAAGVAAAGAFAALAVLWILFLASWPRNGRLVLLVAAFFPGLPFLHGAFPMGLLVTAVLCALHLARRRRWGSAGLAGAAAALSHSVGWFLGPVLVAWGALVGARDPDPAGRVETWRGTALAAIATMAGLGALLALHHAVLGHWDAYFRVQRAYGHQLASPLASWWAAARGLVAPPWEGVAEAPAAQAVVVAALVASSLVLAARRRDGEAGLVSVYVLAMWLLPLTLGGTVSVYRTDAALLPGVLLARDAPRGALAGALVVLVPLAWGMARLFFELRLV
jgi:hypothetical protein